MTAGEMGACGPVVVDLRAVQSPEYRGRGIARRAYEEAAALERVRPDLVGAYLLDPTWPPPGPLDELLVSGKLCYLGTSQAQAALEAATVYHCVSPFELDRTISQVRPPFVDQLGLRYAATLHDLIPLQRRSQYLAHPSVRRRYLSRLEVLRSADAVLAVSAAAAADARTMLGLDDGRMYVVGSGVARRFVPPRSRDEAREVLVRQRPELSGPFIVFSGGHDLRKNTERLLAAFAALPLDVRQRYHLVVVGELPSPVAAHYRYLAHRAGMADRLVLTGFVSDAALVQLYQATTLVVFPSLAEGFGLPVAEGLACGAVACVSDRPPLDELVPDARARFDPEDEGSITDAMVRCLTDEDVRQTVRRDATTTVSSWDAVAERVATVLEGLSAHPRRPWRASGRMAVVLPLPPVPGRVARFGARLVAAMERAAGEGLEIDCFVDGEHRGAPGAETPPALRADRRGAARAEPPPRHGRMPRDAAHFTRVDGAVGGYDHVLYVLGNSPQHRRAVEALRRRTGTVLAHDVRMSELLSRAPGPGHERGGDLESDIARSYPGLPDGLGRTGHVGDTDAERYGLYLLKEIAADAERVAVCSESARELAAVDVGPELADRIGVVPYAVAQLSEEEMAAVDAARRASDAEDPARRPIVASFGIDGPAARPDVVVEAVSLLAAAGHDVECHLVGALPTAVRDRTRSLAGALGISTRVHLDGDLEREARGRYLELLGRTDVAVQLRDRFDGECSGAVSDCLCAGVPTVVEAVGWMGEIPGNVVVLLRSDCDPAALADAVAALLATPGRRAAVGRRARAWAGDQTFVALAESLLDAIGAGNRAR